MQKLKGAWLKFILVASELFLNHNLKNRKILNLLDHQLLKGTCPKIVFGIIYIGQFQRLKKKHYIREIPDKLIRKIFLFKFEQGWYNFCKFEFQAIKA